MNPMRHGVQASFAMVGIAGPVLPVPKVVVAQFAQTFTRVIVILVMGGFTQRSSAIVAHFGIPG